MALIIVAAEAQPAAQPAAQIPAQPPLFETRKVTENACDVSYFSP